MRRRRDTLLAACIAAGLAGCWIAPASAQEPPLAGGDSYLEQLRVEREEGWFQRELREMRTYPHLDRAYRLMAAERLSEARVELERYLSLDAEDLEVRFTYLLLVHRLVDHAEVIRQADRLLAARPGFVPALLYRGMAHAERGAPELARSDFQAVAASEAEVADRVFALEMWADLAFDQQRYDEVSKVLDQLEAAGGEGFGLHFRRGLARDGEDRHRQALEAFQRALEATDKPEHRLQAHRALGEVALELEDWALAEEALGEALELAPEEPELARSMAHATSRLGRHRQAAEHMRRALDLESRPEDLEFLANALFLDGDFSGAAQTFARLLESLESPADRYRIHLALGTTYERLSRFDRAAAAFGEAARHDLTAEALEGWGRALEKDGRLPEAIEVYRRLLVIRPDARMQFRLGTMHAQSGDHEAAIRHLRTAAEGSLPGSLRAAAYRQLGYLEAGRDRHQVALKAFEEALALSSGNDARLFFALGETCNRLREFDRAVTYLEQGLALEESPTARRALAWAQAGAGRPEESIRAYRELLEAPASARATADVLAHMAHLELERNRPEEAAELLLEALERQPSPDSELLEQAAEGLALARRWPEAAEVNRRLLASSDLDRRRRGRALERQGEILMQLESFEAAARFYSAALEAGRDGARLHQALGFAELKLGRADAAVNRFKQALVLDATVESRISLARCYDLLGRPGTALFHLKQAVPELDRLPAAERMTVLDELGYLYAQQADYEAAAEAWRERLELGDEPRIALRYGATLRRLGRSEEALSVLSDIEAGSLSPALDAERLDQLAGLAVASGDPEEAVELLLKANELEPEAARQYQLGLVYQALDRPDEAVDRLERAVEAAPETTRYREALGYSYTAIDAFGEAIEAFETVVDQDPDYLSLYQDLGYLHLRQANAPLAVEWFERAIDNRPLYSVHSPAEEAALEADLDRMRREVSKLSNRLDLTLYVAVRGETLPSTATPALGGGVLPSQGGLEVAFLPPRLGFRNERVFQIFGRVLTDVRPGSLDVDEESYQGGVGLRYKPFRSRNLYLSGERLFKIGDDSQNNWLLRALYSWDRGYALRPGDRLWSYSFLYLDAGYLVEAPSYWAYFGELRQGLTINLEDRFLLTPHLVVAGRYQDPGGALSSYVEGGGGLSLKLFYGGGRYRDAGGSLEILLQYRLGRFVNQSVEVTEESFDGFLTTAVFQF